MDARNLDFDWQHFDTEDIERLLGELNENQTELSCELRKRLTQDFVSGCSVDYDTVLCWPQTPTNTVAVLPCLYQLNGIRYDTTRKL